MVLKHLFLQEYTLRPEAIAGCFHSTDNGNTWVSDSSSFPKIPDIRAIVVAGDNIMTAGKTPHHFFK